MTSMRISHGRQAAYWIEAYCLYPSGPDKGKRVVLTPAQRATVHRVFDNPDGQATSDVIAPLSAYLALFSICGPRSTAHGLPPVAADIFSVWNATGPELRDVLRREGECITCPELGTRYPAAA